jgi:geranylgeranyl pyrophosphate synthase
MHRAIADGLLRMAAGQQRDLQLAGSESVTVEEVEASVVAKSGEEVAMFMRLVGLYVGQSPAQCDGLAAMGRAWGTASQLRSDCHDIFQTGQSRDLAHGGRTVPIAYHLQRLSPVLRSNFLQRLAFAQRDSRLHNSIRQELLTAGALRFTAFLIQMYCQRAHNAIEKLRVSRQGAMLLHVMIDAVSFFPP